MARWQCLILIFFLVISTLSFIRIYDEIKVEKDNYIENIGDNLSQRLLNVNKIVSNFNGLYKIEDRYVFRGICDNYIKYNNELWKIVSLESDGTVKIVRDEILSGYLADELNTKYYETLDKEKIILHDFNVASFDIYSIRNFDDVINLKEEYKENYVCLLNVKDVMFAATDVYFDEYLDTYFWVNEKYNYLYKNGTWQLSSDVFVKGDFLKIGKTENLRPVVYLKPSLMLEKGKGTKSNPYILKGE